MRYKAVLQNFVALLLCGGFFGPAEACSGISLDSETIYGGPHCLVEKPKRVIALDPPFAHGIGLDVDLPIVGAPLTRMGDASLNAEAESRGVENLRFVTEPSLERIVALKPDLIVGFVGSSGWAESIYPLFPSSRRPSRRPIQGGVLTTEHLPRSARPSAALMRSSPHLMHGLLTSKRGCRRI